MYLGRCKYWQAAYAEAQPLLLEALSHFETHGDDRMTMWASISMGDCLFYSEAPVAAQEWFQKGLVLAQQREDPFCHAWAYTCLGRVAHAIGDHHMALFYLDRALPVFREIGVAHDVAHVLLEQGRIAEAQGLTTQAYRYYAESLTIFARSRMQRVPECLEGIASLIADRQPTHATQLLGAAAAIRESVGVPLAPVYRAAYERTVTAARDQLGAAAYAAAWVAGRMLTLEQALNLALAVADTSAEAQ
jgi:non-specific serine/threonine protein kinase